MKGPSEANNLTTTTYSVWKNVFRAVALLVCIFISCSRSSSTPLQGYVEGEFVYVSSPLSGALETLSVERGAQVKSGDLLFVLESEFEQSEKKEAEKRLAQARANLEDAKKGKRPSELESIEAQLRQARAVLSLAEKEWVRQEKLFQGDAISEQELDRTRSTKDQSVQKVAQLEADLKTAQLGSRDDQITAAEANVHAQEAIVAKANWAVTQKQQSAPQAGVIFDTLYRKGEWVAAGRPVVTLLPPQNIKVRAFVPETQIANIHLNNPAQVLVDGVKEPSAGKVSFVSPKAEYTPPVIYSQENRSKLVFMVEIIFDPQTAAKLHPGQPVNVRFENR